MPHLEVAPAVHSYYDPAPCLKPWFTTELDVQAFLNSNMVEVIEHGNKLAVGSTPFTGQRFA